MHKNEKMEESKSQKRKQTIKRNEKLLQQRHRVEFIEDTKINRLIVIDMFVHYI